MDAKTQRELHKKNLSKNIKRMRKEKNLTQSKLAQKSGLHTTMISSYENRREFPELTTIMAIAHILEVPYYELLECSDCKCQSE